MYLKTNKQKTHQVLNMPNKHKPATITLRPRGLKDNPNTKIFPCFSSEFIIVLWGKSLTTSMCHPRSVNRTHSFRKLYYMRLIGISSLMNDHYHEFNPDQHSFLGCFTLVSWAMQPSSNSLCLILQSLLIFRDHYVRLEGYPIFSASVILNFISG